jgi:hypothetical protein
MQEIQLEWLKALSLPPIPQICSSPRNMQEIQLEWLKALKGQPRHFNVIKAPKISHKEIQVEM